MLDIRDARIDSVLQSIVDTHLCEVPGDDPWTVEHFQQRTEVSLSNGVTISNN